MFSLWELQSIKDTYGNELDEYYGEFTNKNEVFKESENDTHAKDEFDVAISEGTDSIYGKPDIKVNIPMMGSLEINFEPVLNIDKGEFTEEAESVDAVKSDPYDISPISDPEDPLHFLNSEKENEDDTQRYMTLQDLM